jgi:hypothetical protein
VAQNLLNHLVGNSESVQIGRKPAPECVPAMPYEILFLHGRPDHIHRERFEIHRVTEFIRKNEPLAWPATPFPVLVEKKFQPGVNAGAKIDRVTP